MKQHNIRVALSSALTQLVAINHWENRLGAFAGKINQYVKHYKEMRRAGYSPTAILQRFYQKVDQEMQSTEKAHNEYQASCHRGCAFCCKMNVDISKLEAERILEYTHGHNIPIDRAYLQRQAALPKMEVAFHPAIAACVFLQKDNTCGIYEARPFACRKYLVASPAEQCNIEKYPTGNTQVIVDIETELIVSAFGTLDDRIDALPRMLLEQLKETPVYEQS